MSSKPLEPDARFGGGNGPIGAARPDLVTGLGRPLVATTLNVAKSRATLGFGTHEERHGIFRAKQLFEVQAHQSFERRVAAHARRKPPLSVKTTRARSQNE